MNWSSLIAFVTKFFDLLPQIRALLEELFGRAKLGGDPATIDPPAAINRLFSAARAETWWFQFAKRSRLAVAHRVAMNHAAELYQAAKYNLAPPQMTVRDRAEFNEVL